MIKLISLTAGLCSFLTVAAQSITGNWEGDLDANGTKITIVFHITKDSTGNITGTFDSPKQMAYGLACSKISVKADSVLIEMKAFGATCKGRLNTDHTFIAGNWSQGGMSLPLDLKKTSDIATVEKLKRPQTPGPPFNYYTEDVSYKNSDNTITFGGTFTRPSYSKDKVNKLKYPVCLLITGSGQQDRDETIFDHKPFAVIADHLARQGIATLRVDDRGKGKTTGNFRLSTTLDFAKDAEAGIEYLRSRKDVDVNNIGIAGHSEGGMIAYMVAAKRKDLKFIVLLAAPGVPILNLMEQQTIDIASSNGVAREELEMFRPLYKAVMMAAIRETDSAEAAKNIVDIFTDWQVKNDSSTVKNTTGVSDKASLDKFAGDIITEVHEPWFNYFIKFKPADYLTKVRCAVLALNGDKDIQVSAAANLEAIREIMVKKMVRTFKVQSLPGLNHLFQHCTSCTIPEYAQLEETVAPEALQIISGWIKQVVN